MLQEVVIKATNEEKIEMVKNGEYPLDQFLRDNDGLVYKVISIYELRHPSIKEVREDAYSQGMLGLWKAYQAYDKEKGNLFSTVAWKYIDTEVRLVCRDYFRYRENYLTSTLEDAPEPACDDEVVFEMLRLSLDSIKITKRQRQYYERYLQLQSYVEVAKELGTSKQTVKQAVKYVQDKLKDKYLTVR